MIVKEGMSLTIIFTEEAWEFAKQQAREITITQERCRG